LIYALKKIFISKFLFIFLNKKLDQSIIEHILFNN